MALDLELDAFARMKEQLLVTHEGKFVVIHDQKLVGAYDSAENAYTAGVQAFGQDLFLVKKVLREEPVYTNHALANGLINARL
jgi:hypothetical protein